ncbi:hypothetical protein HZC21_03115 [Candidatus Peregrinibacteria bacterium]|nr:hypothetical protein [Candidatus Peregrinibacteria bacterium]
MKRIIGHVIRHFKQRREQRREKRHEQMRRAKPHAHLFEKAVFTWSAPEYIYHKKTALWFIVAGFVAIALVIYGLMTNGWTFSVAIIVFAGTYYSFYKHAPQNVEVKISRVGVKIGRHLFPYGKLKSFWIVYDPPLVKRLYLRTTSRLHPDIFISLQHADPSKIRSILKEHILEKENGSEPFADALVRAFKL